MNLIVIAIFTTAISLNVALDTNNGNRNGLISRLRGVDGLGAQLRKFAKTSNPLEQSFDNSNAEQDHSVQGLTTPIESSVSKSLTSKKIEYLPYVGSLFFGVSVSALMQSMVPLEMATGAEIAFAVYCFSLVRSTFQKPAELEPMPDYDREWDKLWTDVFDSVPDVSKWLEDWFLDSKIEDICIEDVEEFMCWAMFSTTPEFITVEQKVELDSSVALLAKRCQTTFAARGSDTTKTQVRSMRSTIEPLQWFHKPLIFYLLTQGLASQALKTQLKGFIQKKVGGLTYWIGDGKASSESETGLGAGQTLSYKSKVPFVFYHGVGGLVYYTRFLKSIEELGIPVVAVEMPYVSLHVAPNVPSIDEHVEGFRMILDEIGAEKAIVAGHSWGSNVISWLCQSSADRVAGAVFLDPVVFMLHLRNITYNWFYKNTSAVKSRKYPAVPEDAPDAARGGGKDAVVFKWGEKGRASGGGDEIAHNRIASDPSVEEGTGDGIMSLIKSELFTNHALQRPYVWFRNVLFAHEMEKKPFRTTILVSELDPIVPSEAVTEHVLKHRQELRDQGQTSRVQVKVLPGATHGSFVFEKDYLRSVTDLISEAYTIGVAELSSANNRESESLKWTEGNTKQPRRRAAATLGASAGTEINSE